MKKKKIVNTDDNDLLNPMEGIGNYGPGTHNEILPETGEDDDIIEDEEIDSNGTIQDKPFPDEIINPEEQEDETP